MNVPIKTGVVLLIIIVGGAIAWQVLQNTGSGAAASATPPPGAQFLNPEWTAERVLLEVGSHKQRDGSRDAAAAQFEGCWIGDPGWRHAVYDFTRTDGGTRIRVSQTASGPVLGGQFWLIASVPAFAEDFAEGDMVTLRGRINRVEVILVAGMAAPEYRLTLDPAEVAHVDRVTR